MDPRVLNVAIFIGLTHWSGRRARAEQNSVPPRRTVHHRREGFRRQRPPIVFRHIIPNILTTIVVVMTTQIGYMIIVESSLSFFGMTGSTISWGWDISQGRDYLSTAWWITSMPGIAILITVISFNILGDWLRDVLDPPP